MIEVPLTRAKVAIIDDSDGPIVLAFKWTALQSPRTGKWYARRTGSRRLGLGNRIIYLHRFLMAAPDGVQVDHKNGDGLDNRRDNLRLANNSQNHQNMKRQWRTKSGFKGVIRRGKRWVAQITLNQQTYWCGTHDTAELAAKAYDHKAKELFGDFARLNFPEDNEPQRSKAA